MVGVKIPRAVSLSRQTRNNSPIAHLPLSLCSAGTGRAVGTGKGQSHQAQAVCQPAGEFSCTSSAFAAISVFVMPEKTHVQDSHSSETGLKIESEVLCSTEAFKPFGQEGLGGWWRSPWWALQLLVPPSAHGVGGGLWSKLEEITVVLGPVSPG